jgi:DNA-binding response OmpR family regulator
MKKPVKRILIVEDEKLTSKLLVKILTERLLEPLPAASLKEAALILQQGPVDLILLDRILPDGDGVKLLLKLREQPAFKHVPVLILSGKDTAADQADGLDLGADDYMTKPFSMLELRARVDALLRRAEKFKKNDF